MSKYVVIYAFETKGKTHLSAAVVRADSEAEAMKIVDWGDHVIGWAHANWGGEQVSLAPGVEASLTIRGQGFTDRRPIAVNAQ